MFKMRYALFGWLALKAGKIVVRRKAKSGGRKWRRGR
jgi:hypothetical protein